MCVWLGVGMKTIISDYHFYFYLRLQEFKLGSAKSGKTADGLLSQRHSVEIGCLYVINQSK